MQQGHYRETLHLSLYFVDIDLDKLHQIAETYMQLINVYLLYALVFYA